MLRQGVGRGRFAQLQLFPRPARNRRRTGRGGATSGAGRLWDLGVEGTKVRVRADDVVTFNITRLLLLYCCTLQVKEPEIMPWFVYGVLVFKGRNESLLIGAGCSGYQYSLVQK